MENITFFEQINLFWKIKAKINPRPACICRHGAAYIARVLESYERKVFCIKVEVWNESHIVWKPFQTPLHPLRDDFVACILVEETYLTLQLHSNM